MVGRGGEEVGAEKKVREARFISPGMHASEVYCTTPDV